MQREGVTTMADKPNNDLVPAQWKSLFTNEEWMIHGIVVKSMYGFGAIALVAHILIWSWKPWF
jgi:light-harvesting complex 1 beta chain